MKMPFEPCFSDGVCDECNKIEHETKDRVKYYRHECHYGADPAVRAEALERLHEEFLEELQDPGVASGVTETDVRLRWRPGELPPGAEVDDYERGWRAGAEAEAEARKEGLAKDQLEVYELYGAMLHIHRDPIETLVTAAYIMQRSWWRRLRLAFKLVTGK